MHHIFCNKYKKQKKKKGQDYTKQQTKIIFSNIKSS